jgi:hypothetical protein
MSARNRGLLSLAAGALVASAAAVALSAAPAHASGIAACTVTTGSGCMSSPVSGGGSSSLRVTAPAACSVPFKIVRLSAMAPDYIGEAKAGETFIDSPSFLFGTYYVVIEKSCPGGTGRLEFL